MKIQSYRRFWIVLLPMSIGCTLFCACGGLGLYFEWPNIKSTPIIAAVSSNNADNIEKVLDEHPELLEVRNKLGHTPLTFAVWNNKDIAVVTLIRRGADVNARWLYGSGWNALHCAAATGHLEIARSLQKAGVNINEKSEKGQTPLDVAIERQHPGVADFLRAQGGKLGSELP